MKVGDTVLALLDESRGFTVPGIVIEIKQSKRYHEGDMQNDIKVIWASATTPVGWWREDQLRVISVAS